MHMIITRRDFISSPFYSPFFSFILPIVKIPVFVRFVNPPVIESGANQILLKIARKSEALS